MTARIMIVEDERIVALDLKTALESIGYAVVKIASRGSDAVHYAAQLQPDLILMDIHLQDEVDGTEAALKIREKQKVPVVFLTAYAEEKTLQRAELSFPYGYLLKPFELRELEATIRMALARRKAEAQIEEAEERLRLAVDAAALGVWEWESQSNEFRSMGHFEKILGMQPTLIKESITTFLARFDEADQQWIEAALANGEQINSTMKMKVDNQLSWIDLHAKFYPGADKNSSKVIGVIRDVTERRIREEQLRQANVVYNTMSEGILILDANRKIVSCNPAFNSITGFEIGQVIGCDPDDFLHVRRHSDGFYSQLGSDLKRNWQGEIACRTVSETVFPAWQQVCCVQEADGTIINYVVIISDISALRKAEAHINHLAFHDALTGLGNRHLMESRLVLEIERANHTDGRLALILLDLDGFKGVNDALGHLAGDELLKTVATRIQSHLRSSDIAIRLGGDEFIVIVPDIKSPASCVALAEKLLADVRGDITIAPSPVSVSASIGIALYPDNAADSVALIRAADRAMYAAKEQGKNKYCFYNESLASAKKDKISLQQQLARAQVHDEFEIYYEPQVDLHSGEIVALDALLRWNSLERGTVLPAEFLTLLADSGMENKVLEWFFQQIVTDAACLIHFKSICEASKNLLRNGFKICFGLSSLQLRDETLLNTLDRIIFSSSLKASQIEIEVTENVLQQIDGSKPVLDALASRGVSLALDNFGTGYSSIAVLKSLPIQRLKIDQSFIKSIFSDAKNADIAVAIAAMAKSLGLKLAADGVQTLEQLEFVKGLGCETAQGEYFSDSLSLDRLLSLLESRAGNWSRATQ